MHTYYAVKTGPDRYDMRQERFRKKFDRGIDHPHDVCATGFTAQGLRDVCEKYKFDCDFSALP